MFYLLMSWEDSSEPQRANTKGNQEQARGLASSSLGGSEQPECSREDRAWAGPEPGCRHQGEPSSSGAQGSGLGQAGGHHNHSVLRSLNCFEKSKNKS